MKPPKPVGFSFAGIALLCANFANAQSAPKFIDVSKRLPVEHVYGGGWEHYVGGGVAVFDCNGDDLADVFVAGGENPTQLLINVTQGAGRDIEFKAADEPVSITGVTGAYPINIDNDAHTDIVVLRVGKNMILKGLGNCLFEDSSQELGFSQDDKWTTSFSATWEDENALPTLAIGNYVDRTNPDGPFEACDTNELHRPSGEKYVDPIILKPGFCALSMLFSDWQRTGTTELRLSNDRHYYVKNGSEQMLRLETLEFRDNSDGWENISIWGMGIASGDINGDAQLDVMMTSMGDQLLQLGTAQGLKSVPFSFGTYAHRPYVGDDGRPSTGWHVAFEDVNNDGLLDVFIAKGNVDQMPGNAMHDPNNLLMQQVQGHFQEMGDIAGLASDKRGRGAAVADLNNDGLLDIIVVNRRSPMEVFQNASRNTGNWIAIDPRQSGKNINAIGAWIEVRSDAGTQISEVTIGGGHAGGKLMPIHFGLGTAIEADIRITWPGGPTGDWQRLEANQIHRVQR